MKIYCTCDNSDVYIYLGNYGYNCFRCAPISLDTTPEELKEWGRVFKTPNEVLEHARRNAFFIISSSKA